MTSTRPLETSLTTSTPLQPSFQTRGTVAGNAEAAVALGRPPSPLPGGGPEAAIFNGDVRRERQQRQGCHSNHATGNTTLDIVVRLSVAKFGVLPVKKLSFRSRQT